MIDKSVFILLPPRGANFLGKYLNCCANTVCAKMLVYEWPDLFSSPQKRQTQVLISRLKVLASPLLFQFNFVSRINICTDSGGEKHDLNN